MHRVALVFVFFPHDDVLDVGKRESLVQVQEVFERQVLMEILHDVGVEGREVLIVCVWHRPVGTE